ncbi:alkaline phosphatase [Microbulbifer hydrolyticus]|uniref:Alkaline phosphatase n=1 Tax=Microbulbifer hydrolyticus TaxID=48074 RepID=A0A6P1T7K4_9GAMM|nr:alkaline phosphatase [Microbulbifer hydrolyticus]MBB5211615.1 alkaline phosphatase [Microbulbifer hydrolyticus]QHQ37650.1 alkaline phosphatase [Microbulbifer hydrolyticus]
MQPNRFSVAFAAAFAITVAACSDNNSGPAPQQPQPQPEPAPSGLSLPESQRASSWYQNGEAAIARARDVVINNERGAAKNVILFVGDGMGISTVTAARILAGQLQGESGEEHQLSFEKMPFAGLIKTYNTNQQTADSAGTATAMVTGVKTKAGVLSVDETVARGDCAASLQRPLTTALELAESLGKSTGVVSTARITHATPASTYSKVPERGWEYAAPEGCTDIATQMVELAAGDGIDVVMGGGRRSFLPQEVTDLEGKAGKRIDGVNLVEAWQSRYQDGVTNALYIEDKNGFDGIDVASTDKLLGLFESSHMRYEADRKNDVAGEPSLSEMTAKAIELLSKNDRGYFMMVESGRIDHGHHASSAYSALTDAVEMANAVQVAMDSTSAEDTLIIVTADHSHVMTIAGYPTRGNPILGKVVTNNSRGEPEPGVALAADGMPYTTITYANGLGHAHYGSSADADDRYEDPVSAGRQDISASDTESPGYHQEALVPLGGETHGGEDVGIWARGPGAHLLSGTNEQSFIFHVMAHAGGLIDR